MDRLWAVKNQFDPFRWLVGFGGLGLLPIFRCTFYQCPHCRRPFKVTWGPSNSLLGSGERECWHCKQVFRDGSNEWPEMNSKERRLFLVPITVAGIIGAFLLMLGLAAWTFFFLRPPAHFDFALLFEILGLPIAFWFGFRILQIVRSVRRYNAQANPGAK